MLTDHSLVDWRMMLKILIQRVENPFYKSYISTIKKMTFVRPIHPKMVGFV
jgi:hypothetical protein